jgi:hypothetical protein
MNNHQVQDARPNMPTVGALVGNVDQHAVSVICRVFFLSCRVPSNSWLLYKPMTYQSLRISCIRVTKACVGGGLTTNEMGTPRACEVCEEFTHFGPEVGH